MNATASGETEAGSRSGAETAADFRAGRDAHRRGRWEVVVEVIAVALIVLGAFAILTAKPIPPGGDLVTVPTGPPIHVTLGTPVVTSVTCGDGSSATVERVPWENASVEVGTGVVQIRVIQLGDGDIVADGGVPATATPTNACAGAPPSGNERWYGVLADPNGTNVDTFTFDQQWHSVTNASWNVPIENGSSVLVVENPSLAAQGYGLQVVGLDNGSTISGLMPL